MEENRRRKNPNYMTIRMLETIKIQLRDLGYTGLCYFKPIYIKGTLKYVFVSKEKVEQKDYYIEGRLFDVGQRTLVKCPEMLTDKTFYKYYLFDEGIPNVILDEEDGSYKIMLTYDDTTYFITSLSRPVIVSYNGIDGSYKRSYVIFKKNKNNSLTRQFVISNEYAVATAFEDDIHIYECIYMTKERLNDDELLDDKKRQKYIREMPRVYHLYDTEFVVLISEKGELGQYVFFFPAFNKKVEYESSCMNYEQVYKNVEIAGKNIEMYLCCEMNDFEVDEYMLTVTNETYYPMRLPKYSTYYECRGQ